MNNFNWFPGHMNKALKNIENKLSAIDLVIEIVDARAPQASSNPTLHKILGSKPILKLLSKIDLADPKVTKQWIDWYQKNNINAISLEYKNSNFNQNLIKAINKSLEDKLNKWKSKGLLNPKVNVLIVGIPNVGKSTFINKISKSSKTIVSNYPGVTRGLQIIQLTSSINVIDTPGILPPQLDNWENTIKLVAINSIKKGIYPIEEIGEALAIQLYQNYPNYWIKNYPIIKKTKSIENGKDLFNIMAKQKKYEITPNFNWELLIIQPFIEDVANGKFGFSFETPSENF